MSEPPTIAANRLSPVIDSNWFWIANRSATMQRRTNPMPCIEIASASVPMPSMMSHRRPVPKASMSVTSEMP